MGWKSSFCKSLGRFLKGFDSGRFIPPFLQCSPHTVMPQVLICAEVVCAASEIWQSESFVSEFLVFMHEISCFY